MEQNRYQQYFQGKKITLMGLGLLGRGIGVAKFLAANKAKLLITDLKNQAELQPALKQLKKIKNIEYALDGHRLKDFQHCDMVIKAAGVPLNSPFIREARRRKIPVEMDASLFAKLSPAKIIGVTGTRGKSTVACLIYHCLCQAFKESGRRVFLAGNIKGTATMPLLEKTKSGDIAVLELDSWQLQGFGDSRFSPSIAVFTNFMEDHLNYYQTMQSYFRDKTNIFRFQKKEDYLIASPQAEQEIKKRFAKKILSRLVKPKKTPGDWRLKILGEHNKLNAALAMTTLEIFGVSRSAIKQGLESFPGLPGRLEFIRNFQGADYYNDTNATTPDATIAGLNALKAKKRRIVLLAGGSDKKLDYRRLTDALPKFIKALILFKGNASDKIISRLPPIKDYSLATANNMEEALSLARKQARKNDIILLSPASASFGLFKNEYDRGEQFVKLVKKF